MRDSLLGPLALLLLLLALWAALSAPGPLLVNLGAGDEAFARGFRPGWERDGLQGSGETQFHWTLDGARLELPLRGRSPSARLRLRAARFAAAPADITLMAGGRVVAQWRQPPRGWRVQEVELGPWDGPLALQFRSQSPGGEEMGLALDWVEWQGIGRLRPDARTAAGLLALMVGPALLAAALTRRVLVVLGAAGIVAAASVVAIRLDRLGGLLALSRAGPPLLLVLALLAAVAFALGRRWPEQVSDWRRALALPAVFAALALIALSQPFFHYPDVDTHARFVQALRRDPVLLFDASDYQARSGAWMREVAGRKVPFPYSPVFHLAALPLADLWDAVTAVKTLGVLAAAITVLLAHPLARALGLGGGAAALAQALLALLPVMASRLTLALFPALLGQALETLLVAHLMRRLVHLEGARDAAAVFAFLFVVQLAYTGSLINAAALVGILCAVEAARGEWRRAARLGGAWALALGLVVAILYARFLPVLWQQVLPHLHQAPAEAPAARGFGSLLRLAAARAAIFYGLAFPLLTAAGLLALRGADARARRVLACVLAAGGALLVLRFTAPALFRDAKEVELVAPAVAVASAAALSWLWARRGAWRAAAVAGGAAAMVWSAARAVAFYEARLLAIGR